ncbi:cellulase family glycosylhydrolase [Microlunatus ginsengisoli]|uniref:Endoglucanase n=1 Tax=Microlunatus ginsengisoli TaxID=363863 RepID=A0ABP6ZKV4_9ACTN
MSRPFRPLAALGLLVGLLLGMLGVSAIPAQAGPTGSGWLHTDGGRIVDDQDRTYVVKGVNWFGLETPNCAPHGLWQIGLDAGLAQIASFGFNTIRLPFSNECLASQQPVSGIDGRLNPDLVGETPLQVMDAVVAGARRHGLRVVLDRHRPDSGSQSELWYTSAWSEQRWIADWQALARRYADDPTVIGADLHNEPHGRACLGCGDPSRDWAAAATRAGNAVLAVNPRLLILVEGVEQQRAGGTWWGGGLADARTHPIRLDVEHRLVYSPHDYPASIYPHSWFADPRYPANLDDVWTANWGYLARDQIAPVLLGEFGTKLQTDADRAWLGRLVDYLGANRMSFAYWSFNPNSGDTGGLVADDWTTPQREKLAALAPLLGGGTSTGSPSPAPSGPVPTPPVSPNPTPTHSPTPTPSLIPTPTPSQPSSPSTAPTAPGSTSASWQLSSSWNGGYVAQLQVGSTTARNGWRVSWPDPAATSIANSWGLRCAVAGGVISCDGADWAASITAGQTVYVGLQVNSPGPAPTNPSLTLN